MAALQVENLVTFQQQEIVRPVANFSPSLWGDLFASSSFDDNQVSEIYGREMEELKEKVRRMIVIDDEKDKLARKLILIDTIERLGLSYHFDKEIEDQLTLIFNDDDDDDDHDYEDENSDLFITALRFRLLRQHGFDVPSSIFEKFTENGEFKESLGDETKGLLSLYEASYLRYHGETILEDALAFTTKHLVSCSDHMWKQVKHALEQSHQRGVRRIEARHSITFYEDDESKDESILRLAKLDYNLLQVLHRGEMHELTRWWREMDLVTKLSYPRDRLVECYFFALGTYVEPQYSRARVKLAKVIAMISVIDDTFDSYGTIDELEIFTSVIERWDINEMHILPDYMKICFRALIDLYDDYERELTQHERSFAVIYAKQAMIEIVKCYNIEAKWFIEGYMPTFDEYIKNGFVTSTYQLLAVTSLIGMASASDETFAWIMAKPRIQVANMAICRIIDDTATYETEKKRGQVATGIECYMKQYGVSEKEAMEAFHDIAENAWKDINEEYVREDSVSKEILKRIVNFSRLIDVTYKNDLDGYTDPEKVLKPHITGLLLDSFDV